VKDLIKIENLSFKYSEKHETIKNISLEIPKGKWVSILGHNGSGKSTLAKLLMGLLRADEGDILIGEEKILLTEDTLQQIRKKMGIVFQNPDNQFVGVTVLHDIAFGMENQQVPREEMLERINHYASLVDMQDYLHKGPHELSGGQKQRVAIAGALAMDLEIMIFDEATSMLDPKGTNEIVELIQRLNKEYQKTIITITHDLEFANLSDHLIVMRDGEIILEGTPEEVFKEEELLKSSNLELPLALKLQNDLKKYNFSNKDKIMEALWKYGLKK
jgi:energy-coupling factor transport system ATP-binding protein